MYTCAAKSFCVKEKYFLCKHERTCERHFYPIKKVPAHFFLDTGISKLKKVMGNMLLLFHVIFAELIRILTK